MNQELMILLVSVNEANGATRHDLCRSNHITSCEHVSCRNCLLQIMPVGHIVGLINTARELAYEPRTNSNTQFPVQVR